MRLQELSSVQLSVQLVWISVDNYSGTFNNYFPLYNQIAPFIELVLWAKLQKFLVNFLIVHISTTE